MKKFRVAFLIIPLWLPLTVTADTDPPPLRVTFVDSIVETQIERCDEELESYLKVADDIDFGVMAQILLRSKEAGVALWNFKVLWALDKNRAIEMLNDGDIFISLGDEELLFIVYGEAWNQLVIDNAAKKIQTLISVLDQIGAIEVSREFPKTWRDISDGMLRKSMFLENS